MPQPRNRQWEREECGVELFLAFLFGWWGKDGRWRGGCPSSLPLCLPRPLPCPFLPLPQPLSGALLLPLPLAMSGSGGLKSLTRFPLPPPNPRSNRRFSSTPSYHYGPRTPHILDTAICYAANFSYDDSSSYTPSHRCLCATPGPSHSIWGHQTPNYRTSFPSSTGCPTLVTVRRYSIALTS